ncbi:hypothetical protein [Aureimonas sp. AU20]|uniref:hypothetical protein n=1 Tax=Aureimonas sp. AU20 TaxID=1349819 RepID=UPI000720956E|nr:hypothetical protein [Aureimonas sp. AU20]ALN74901.1 hypothetical protein M673_19430 [Aureimonas sp. AU20]
MVGQERKAVLKVTRGLHSLVYRFDPAYALDLSVPPIARVEAASEGIFLVTAPGEEFGTLSAPGKGLVVLAEQDGTLHLTIQACQSGGSLDASLELSRIEAQRLSVAAPSSRQRTPLTPGASEFLVRAHVSLRGDLSAARGEWLCGPALPGRIEGLEVRGVGTECPVEYQVATGGRTGGWSSWFPAGAYAGSRGKALPLIGLRLRLTDAAPSDLMLRGEALFLGGSPVVRSGREIEFTGPSPLDPLVGLRLDMVPLVRGETVSDPVGRQDNRPENRLRVFRREMPQAGAA